MSRVTNHIHLSTVHTNIKSYHVINNFPQSILVRSFYIKNSAVLLPHQGHGTFKMYHSQPLNVPWPAMVYICTINNAFDFVVHNIYVYTVMVIAVLCSGTLEGEREQKSIKALLNNPELKFSGLYQRLVLYSNIL